MSPDRPEPDDALTRLPAERQHKDNGVVLYACCCCCCCCCLHTVGGAIGAVLAGNYRGNPPRDFDDDRDEFDYDEDEYYPESGYRRDGYRGRRLPGMQGLFWTSVLIVILLQAVITTVVGVIQGAEPGPLLLVTPCALIMLGPLYFIAACVVLLIRIGINPALRRDGGYFRATLKVLLGTVAGTLIGLIIMVGPVLLIAALNK